MDVAGVRARKAGLRRPAPRDPRHPPTRPPGVTSGAGRTGGWIDETGGPDLPQLIRESLDELKAVTAGR